MITIKKHSGIYTLQATQEVKVPLKEAWAFFSSPKNLEKITPKEMGFNITSVVDKSAYSGQIITYKVTILPFIKSNWVTEITHVEEESFFIDEQRFGPYRMWHHEHFFEKVDANTTLMTDKISYKLPLGFIGDIAHSLFIKKQLKGIFSHRETTLKTLF